MSHLISRILLAILVFPLASLVYVVAFVLALRSMNNSAWQERELYAFPVAGVIGWAFLAIYWFLLWRGSVRFNSRRVVVTVAAAVGSAIGGLGIALLVNSVEEGVGTFVGSAAAPLLWVVATCFLWRESREERAARPNDSGRETIVCPACGYNLTGLAGTRCPECGKQYTLDELLAAQPSRAGAELTAS